MELILLEDIVGLGELGDKVTVKSGYGRNYLLPGKKAVPATPANVEIFEGRRAELEKTANTKLGAARARAEKISTLLVTIAARAGEEGKLFGSVTVRDIAEAVTAKGVPLRKSEVRLPQGPVRELGDFDIDIHLHPEVDTTLELKVVAQG